MDKRAYILSKFPDRHPNASGKLHAKCPFHDDKSPSFSIDVNKGLFVCGSSRCGVRGNFMMFYKLMEGISNWREVYERLRDSRIEVDIDRLFGIQEEIEAPRKVNSWPAEAFLSSVGCCDYLERRGLGSSVVEQFGLRRGVGGVFDGVSIENTIIAPVFEVDGIYKTFQVRFLDPLNKMRWKSPSGSVIQNLLYGGWLVNNRTPDLWIVEGASDVWKMFTYGVQAVGLFTKEASSSQYNKIFYLCTLYGLRPVVCLDGDVVIGKKFKKDYVKKLECELAAFGLSPTTVRLDLDEDPGSLSAARFAEISAQLEVVDGR